MIFLSDLDGVGSEWDGNLDYHALTEAYAHLKIPLRHERTSFSFYDMVEPEVRAGIMEILNRPTYYAELEPIPGWAEAMNRIEDMGHTVFIVTTPWWETYQCASDKIDWVARVAGERFRKRVILTGDKTLVKGDILVDDKPEIHGAMEPTWKRVLYAQPYNAAIDLPRITDWTDWAQVEAVLGLA